MDSFDMELTRKRVEMNVSNGLLYGSINHFDDSDAGLIRHLGSMDMIVMQAEQIMFLREHHRRTTARLDNLFVKSEDGIYYLRNQNGSMRYAVEVYNGNRTVIFDEKLQTQPL